MWWSMQISAMVSIVLPAAPTTVEPVGMSASVALAGPWGWVAHDRCRRRVRRAQSQMNETVGVHKELPDHTNQIKVWADGVTIAMPRPIGGDTGPSRLHTQHLPDNALI